MIKMLRLRVGIVIEEDEGKYHAFCPTLKGLHVEGETEAEALRLAKDAVSVHLDSLVRHNDPIPLGCIEYEKEFSFPRMLARLFSKKPTQYFEEVMLNAA